MHQQKRLIALFLILLVVFIPVYSAEVIAAGYLRNEKISGSDGISGFIKDTAKETDNLKAEVEAKKDIGFVAAGDLRLEANEFDSCDEQSAAGWKKCYNTINNYQIPSNTKSFTLYLYESGTKLVQRSVSLTVDKYAPVVKDFKVNTPVIGPGISLSYSYKIHDYAYEITESPAVCSGIKEFKLYKQGSESTAKLIPLENPTSCIVDSSATLTLADLTALGFGNGKANLCIKARDRISHSNLWSEEKCAEININAETPGVRSINIVGYENNIVLAGKVRNIVVTVNLTSTSGFAARKVYANLAPINPVLSNKQADSCAQVPGVSGFWDCKFNVQTALTLDETPATITVTATDDVGNVQTGSATFNFKVDAAAPAVTFLEVSTKSNAGADVVSWLSSKGNTLALTIGDPGLAAVNKGGVKATFSGLRKKVGEAYINANVAADRQTDDKKTFYWDDLVCQSCTSGLGMETIQVSVSDVAGNTAPVYSKAFNVDSSAPVPRAITFKDAQGAIPGAGDSVIIEVNVEEALSGQVVAVANLTNFRGGTKDKQATCTASASETGVFNCKWEGITIYDSTSYQDVNFTFYDKFGNVKPNVLARIVDTSRPDITEVTVENRQTQQRGWASTLEYSGKGDNTLVAVINDPGAGVNTNTVTAVLGGLGGNVKPDQCAPSGSTHTCRWSERTCSGCVGQIEVSVKATGLSSGLDFTKTSKIPVDNIDPVNIGGIHVAVEGVPEQQHFEDGNNLIIKVNFSDIGSGFWKAAGNFTELLGAGNDRVEITELKGVEQAISGYNVCKEYKDTTALCKDGKCYFCVWKIEDIEGPGDNARFWLTFYDKINRSITIGKEGIKVLVPAGVPGNFWRARLKSVQPDKINIHTIQVAQKERNVYYEQYLEEDGNHGRCAKFEVISISIKDCTGTIGDTSSATNIKSRSVYASSPLVLIGTHPNIRSKEFYSKLVLKNDIFYAEVTPEERALKGITDSNIDKKIPLECTLQIKTQCNTEIYTEDELVQNMDIYLYNDPLGSPSERLNQEIQALMDGNIKHLKIFSRAQRMMDSFAQICNFMNIMAGTQRGLALIDRVTNPWPIVGDIIAAIDWMFQRTLKNRIVEKLSWVCDVISCKKTLFPKVQEVLEAFSEKYLLSLFSSQKVAEVFGEWKRGEGQGNVESGTASAAGQASENRAEVEFDVQKFLNPKNSLVLSIATGCIPGIIYNIDKYRQIDCFHVKCLRDYVSMGWPKFFCDSIRASNKCKYVYGQIFWTIPWAAFADYTMGVIKSLFSDPLSLIFGSANVVCEFNPKIVWVCSLRHASEMLNEFGNAMQSFREFKNWKFVEPFDYCRELDDETSQGQVAGGAG